MLLGTEAALSVNLERARLEAETEERKRGCCGRNIGWPARSDNRPIADAPNTKRLDARRTRPLAQRGGTSTNWGAFICILTVAHRRAQ